MKIIVRKPTEKEKKDAESWPIWQKEKSEFPWEYDEKETCLIIEGRARVKTAEGEASFGPGDYVIFPKGLKCTWIIDEDINKHYSFG